MTLPQVLCSGSQLQISAVNIQDSPAFGPVDDIVSNDNPLKPSISLFISSGQMIMEQRTF
jgi:hypothetical protein